MATKSGTASKALKSKDLKSRAAKKKYADPDAPRPGNPVHHPGHSSGHKGISRVDHAKRNTHGWLVRVAWRGEMHVKFYSDGAHGGKDSAKQKAILYRNRLEKQLGKPRTDRTVMVHHARSETGVLGVHRTIKEGAEVYEVTWSPEPNVVRRTSVSIKKYGEDEAFRRARDIRRKKEKEVFGTMLRAG
jgi:hypothetical protein